MAAMVEHSCPRWPAVLGLLVLGVGCASESADPIVGSGEVVERVEQAMFVEHVEVSLPFHAFVVNGEPRQLLLRGEDNLLDLIHVEETLMGVWQIDAPQDLIFEQHEDIEIEIPYVDMVFLSLDGDVELKEHPAEVDTGS